MSHSEHLVLRETVVPPANEWSVVATDWLFVRLTRGEGLLLESPQPRLCATGDVLVIRGPAPCRLRASQLGELHLHYFQVIPRLLTGFLSATEFQHFQTAPSRARLDLFPAFSPLARQFAESLEAASTGPPLQRRCQLLQLALPSLQAALPAATPSPARPVTAQGRFLALVRSRTEAELCETPPAELARLCGCSVRHFHRLFRHHFGQTLAFQRTNTRLQKACELLASTDRRIIDIALDSGFQHLGVFSISFKKRYGLSPSAWRRRHCSTPRPPDENATRHR